MIAAAALFAAHVTVAKFDGSVRVGKEGSWKDAATGGVIGEDEFLTLAEGAHATVTLLDGKTLVFTGRRVVPGRRLAKKNASADPFFSDALGVLSVDERGSTTAGGVRNCSDADRRAGKCPGGAAPQFDTAAADAATAADAAEKSLSIGKLEEAASLATRALDGAEPADAARAHFVLGTIAADAGNYPSAARELGAVVDTREAPAALRARAALARARVESDTGDARSATADLDTARTLDSGTTGHRATLLLEALALEAGDRAKAEALAAELKTDADLSAAARALLRK